MRFFTCVLDPQGLGLGNRTRQAYELLPRQRGLHYEWQSFESAAVLTGWDDPYGDPLVARDGDWIAAGMVRLDNRQELERRVHRVEKAASDLELVLRVIARYGSEYIVKLLGDFAFVVWNGNTRAAVAACDVFAVRRLYYGEKDGLLAFSSCAGALAMHEEYEIRYLAQIVAQRGRPKDTTAYAGVRSIPRASMAVVRQGRSLTIRQYWHASDYDVDSSRTGADSEAVERCRTLLMESVRLRMGRKGETWAQLSGGIDSSSVVSCAQCLAERGACSDGLSGTVTFVDHEGTGTDEREFSDSVVERWNVPNTAIVNPPTWYDAACELPHLDQPTRDLFVYPRDRRLCATVRGAGGRVLLTGTGGDQLFSGTMLFFADWFVRGHVAAAIKEMARRAAIGRVSFWHLAYRNALLPLLPGAVRSRLVRDQDEVPPIPWLDHFTMKRLGLGRRPAVTAPAYGGHIGRKYHGAVVSMVSTLTDHYQGGVIADSLDVRHPLLYRPLVEFALRLPPHLRARPHEHRWVLRQAMHGILPDKVRLRVGKPSTGDFLAWSLSTERDRLALLTRSPILADLGIIDTARLRASFKAVLQRTHGSTDLCGPLLNTLAVEMWLRIRSGRWPMPDQSTV